MAKKHNDGYLSAKESRRISKQNRKITNEFEKKYKRKNVPESEYLTKMKDPDNVLEIEDLHTYFFTDVGTSKAVDGVTFEVPQGKTVGVVGESGCGKSVTSLSVMQLLQRPQGQIVEGSIRLNMGDGKAYEIKDTPIEAMQHIRGNYVSMIFQEPMTSLNPVFRIGEQLDEVIALHDGSGMSKEAIKERTIELLKMTGLPRAEKMVDEYPFQLSGGQRQRVMIAMALACKPEILIADEPTTALDVTIQAQILTLMDQLKKEIGTSILLITHDLGVVAEVCDDVAVMYCGKIMEKGNVFDVFAKHSHPYTEGLLESIPKLGQRADVLEVIPGNVPSMNEIPKGCRFSDRCKYCFAKCREEEPEFVDLGNGHFSRCWRCMKEYADQPADQEVKSDE